MADLQNFVEDVVTNKINYCAVCFRTEKERKLVPPTALSKFAKYTALEQLSDTEYACMYCERQAQLAVELHDRLCFARHVSRVLWSLINKKTNSPKSIAYVLPSRLRGQLSGPNSVKRNKLLSSMRQYQTYLQTEVQLVDTHTQINNAPDANNEVLIIDDDDSLPNEPPRLVPIEKLLEKQINSDQQTDKILLYPLQNTGHPNAQFYVVSNVANDIVPKNIPVILPNGNIKLTTNPNQNLNLTVNGNLGKTNAVNIANKNLFNTITISVNNKITGPVINNATNVFNKDANMILPIANALNGTNTVLNNENHMAVNTRRGKRLKNDVHNYSNKSNSIGQKQDSISKISDTEKGGNEIADVTTKGDEMCQITNLRTLTDDEFNDKNPDPKKNHTIDWEDKIPMDVISFMNASDPNAPDFVKKNQHETPAHSISTLPLITPTHPVITPTQPHTPLIFKKMTTQKVINQVLDNISLPENTVTDSVRKGRARPSMKRKSVDDDVIIIS